jgi:CheY-like chemotaxis protein
MNGFMGMTELVLDTRLDSEQREHLDMVRSSAEPLLSIINDILEQGSARFFRLILLDAQMPEMDGFALAERIKRNPQWRDVPLMMLSSMAQRGDAKRCRNLGIAALLSKPIRREELLEAILTALRSKEMKESPGLIARHSLRENKRHLATADIPTPSGRRSHPVGRG